MLEDALMKSASFRPGLVRIRRISLGLLLLTVPACGLSDYEKLMRDAQERKERFDEEQTYLGEPVKEPMQKDKDDKDERVINMFFRPPKGILVKSKLEPRGTLSVWRYVRGKAGSDFAYVDLGFAGDDKDFATNIVSSYTAADQARHIQRSVQPPGREKPLLFDAWESNSGQVGHSINILLGTKKPLAVIFSYSSSKDRDYQSRVRKAIELSLQSLAIDKEANAAREVYGRKSPWLLETQSEAEAE